jgi:hypothetical protein
MRPSPCAPTLIGSDSAALVHLSFRGSYRYWSSRSVARLRLSFISFQAHLSLLLLVTRQNVTGRLVGCWRISFRGFGGLGGGKLNMTLCYKSLLKEVFATSFLDVIA